jgi:uncharacterized protein (TIGR03032 family)
VAPRTSPIPLFVVTAAGTDGSALVQSLRGATDVVVAVASVSGTGDGETDAVRTLARTTPDARFVLLTSSVADATPAAFAQIPEERWRRIERDALLSDPAGQLQQLCAFIGVQYDQALLGPIEDVRRASSTPDARSPFASASTNTFSDALRQAGSSLLISTYQSGRLVCARAQDSGLNTHFREFDKPMGIAVAPGRIALGTRTEVWDLRDMPEAAPKIEPTGTHDACLLARNRHVTGDIAVHDLAYASGELWLVATAFSCLATLDADHSFVPRWAPRFITRLAPEDRCHLNGLAVIDDRVAYVTALGTSDEMGGWRARKADGGVLIDVASSEIAIHGLSMPHSPRWHRGRLWLLESGKGSLCVADPAAGSVQTVAELPGFTRGLACIGDIAFVGLSQIRESSTFGDLPITSRLKERQCGVWMVDLRSGAVTGFLRFDDLVQEIFDVAVLEGVRFPEIAEPHGDTTARSYALP